MMQRVAIGLRVVLIGCAAFCLIAAFQTPSEPVVPAAASTTTVTVTNVESVEQSTNEHAPPEVDYWSLLFVFVLATFIGLGVIARVSRLLHTPLMSITNAISAIAVVGSILVTGADYPTEIRIMGAIALFASMTNIVSGFLLTDRMLKMFKQDRKEAKP